MVILHFACIDNSQTSGVCVAVLQHVRAQGLYAETALINVNGVEISGVNRQLACPKPFKLNALPAPFDHPDLAVFHECYRPDYLLIARVLEKRGIPYIIIPHGELRSEAQKKKHLKKWAANLLLFNRFIDRALALQCLSDKEIGATRFGKRKFLGTNGVDIPSEGKSAFRSEGAVFLYIGRYEWQVKGLDLLFEAVRLKAQFLREKRCSFILHGPDAYGRFAAVGAMVRSKGIEDLVSLKLEIVGSEKTAALLDADVFIQTSRHEGMPIGILEAMSCGLPCLVTEGTSLGSEIRDAGAGWVAETTAEDIAEKIVQAVNDRALWPTLGENGRNRMKEKFAWDVIAANTVKDYQKLLAMQS